MDKFGIFNLLNSFFSLNSQKQPSSDNGNVSSALDNLLTNLNSHSKNKQAPAETTKVPFKPLQSSMLSTMNSHDAFIKRVKEKNKT